MPVHDAIQALTEKEKQTLRLIVRGHDAKSTARSLGLSVHTINERLRDARRKMAVSSSREAARLLLAAESADAGWLPDFVGDKTIGDDAPPHPDNADAAPTHGAGRRRRLWMLIGGCSMTLALALLALAGLYQADTPPPAPENPAPAVVDAARQWLALLDRGNWEESYRATGTTFRKQNTEKVWASVSDKVRKPLGPVISRGFLSEQTLPAPPLGYEVVKFRTSFANKADAVETVTLDREDGVWRIVGVMID